MAISLRTARPMWQAHCVESIAKQSGSNKKNSLIQRLGDAIAALDWALAEFTEGQTDSVSGTKNRQRLSRALAALHEIETELAGSN
jgi:hypothetical protein